MNTIKDRYNEAKPNGDQMSKRQIRKLGGFMFWQFVICAIIFVVGGICAGVFIKEALYKWFTVAMCGIGLIAEIIIFLVQNKKIRRASRA